MKKIYLILVCLCFLILMTACNKMENSISQNIDSEIENFETGSSETENSEMGLVMEELEEKFLTKLSEYTDEVVAAIVIDCFENNEQCSAFIITVPIQYTLPEEGDEIEDYFIPSSLWYVDDSLCVNVYQTDYSGSILLSSGTLKDGMCCATVGRLTAYAPEVNYDTCYYTVENGQPVYLFTTSSSVINDEGYIETTESFFEDGRKIKQCTYDYQDGELIFIKEIYVE